MIKVNKKKIDQMQRAMKEGEIAFHQPIGHFVFLFGRVEFWIDQALAKLMEVDYRTTGRYPLYELDFLTRVKLLRVFCRGLGDKIEKNMKTATDEMEELNAFRNNLVHGPWLAYRYMPSGHEEPVWQKPGLSRRFHDTYWDVKKSEIEAKTKRLQPVMTAINETVELALAARNAKRDAEAAAAAPSHDKS